MKIFDIKTSERIFLSVLFAFVVAAVMISRTNLVWFESFYVVEDGPIEWLTVLALFLSSLACFYRVSILGPFRDWRFKAGLVLFGLVFLFGVGEEISWGQRLFGLKSPEYFTLNNSQGETNLHNLIIEGKKINKIIFGTFLGIALATYFLILPVLYRKTKKIPELVNKYAIPIPRVFHLIAYLLLVILCEFIAGGKKGEILEFGGTWIFFILLLRPENRDPFSRKTFER